MAIFIVVSILTISGGTYKFFTAGRSVTALLYLIGTIVVFVLFGRRWFESSSPFSKTPVAWPPVINACPDYLMFYKRTKTDGTVSDTCVDTIGVSKNGTLSIFPKSGDVNPDNDAYFFPLATASSDPSARNLELCERCLQYGLTWEGICNGESCIIPDNGGGSGGGSGGGNCQPTVRTPGAK